MLPTLAGAIPDVTGLAGCLCSGDSLNPNITAQGLWEQNSFKSWIQSGLMEKEIFAASPKRTIIKQTVV